MGVEIYITPLWFRVPIKRNVHIRVNDIACDDAKPQCDCWFEHEYLDNMKNGQCHEEMFSRICSNLENGRCEHLRGERPAKVTIYLIHTAVATNNKKMTHFISRQILKRSNVCLDVLTTGFTYLTSTHTAVLKGSGDALQYVIGFYAAKKRCNKWPDGTFTNVFRGLYTFQHARRTFSIDKRNDVTGNVETFALKGRDVLTYLLAHSKNPSQMKILLHFLPSLDFEKRLKT